MYKEPFIGVGHNPEGPDIPLGFGMQLAQDPQAIETFGKMSKDEKRAIINYIQDCHTGDEAKEHVKHAVNCLHEGRMPGL